MENFSIKVGEENVQVQKTDEKNYIIHSKTGDKHLRLKEDNEGGNHWFEGDGENETAESIQAGKAIEAHIVSNN